jgi:N-methylhydantoinase B/oxoprolinase/acetone carboxylase alpha subunit/acetone carboxylase gamma subunit
MRAARTTLDPVKYELLYQKLDAACNEAMDVVKYLSGSVIAREAGEVVSAFYLPTTFEAASLACGILMHLMTTTRVLRYMQKEDYARDIGIYPDDQFICNDAYIGGMHVPDVVVAGPVFVSDEVVGWVGSVSHTAETGGIEPGGMCPSATEACHDGLIIPPVKIVERGKIRRDLMNMFLRPNRDPLSMEMDIKARIAGNEKLKARVKELAEEFGVDFFKAATEQFVADAEAQCRAKIKGLIPGVYACRVYSDVYRGTENRLGVIHVELEIKEEGEIIIRTPVVSPQIPAVDNAYLPATESTAFYHLLTLLFYDTRWNTALGRALKLDIPEHCRINADPGRSVGYATTGIAGGVLAEGITNALSRALYTSGKFEDVMPNSTTVIVPIWSGVNQFGRPVVQLQTSISSGGGGPRFGRDGHDGPFAGCNPNRTAVDTEGEEMLIPFVSLTNSYRRDSGGFGKYRGGTGLITINFAHGSDKIEFVGLAQGIKIPISQGMYGGYPRPAVWVGLMSDTDFYDAVKEGRPLPYELEEMEKLLKGKFEGGLGNILPHPLKQGDFVILAQSGGSGIGDPIERDPEWIVRDVKENKASVDVSNWAYCTAIDSKTLEIDYEKTKELREQKKKERRRCGIPAHQYLADIIEKRNQKALPKPAQQHHDEMASYSSGYRELLRAEEEWVKKGAQPLDRVMIKKVLLEVTPYINFAEDDRGKKVAVCSKCGFGYCDAGENWKLYGLVHERDSAELLPPALAYPKEWCIYREFYCPGCGIQVEVEGCPPGAPITYTAKIKI